VVQAAGGVGMVILNTGADGIMNDFLAVPTVHLSHTVRTQVRSYVSSAGANARLPRATLSNNTDAPVIAEYSARGPALASDGQPVAKGYLIKPGDHWGLSGSCQLPEVFNGCGILCWPRLLAHAM
jgi:hypothetical protein